MWSWSQQSNTTTWDGISYQTNGKYHQILYDNLTQQPRHGLFWWLSLKERGIFKAISSFVNLVSTLFSLNSSSNKISWVCSQVPNSYHIIILSYYRHEWSPNGLWHWWQRGKPDLVRSKINKCSWSSLRAFLDILIRLLLYNNNHNQ